MKRRRINPRQLRPSFWTSNIRSRERAGQTGFIGALRHRAARRIQALTRGYQYRARRQRDRAAWESYHDRLFERYGPPNAYGQYGVDWDYPDGRGLYEDY